MLNITSDGRTYLHFVPCIRSTEQSKSKPTIECVLLHIKENGLIVDSIHIKGPQAQVRHSKGPSKSVATTARKQFGGQTRCRFDDKNISHCQLCRIFLRPQTTHMINMVVERPILSLKIVCCFVLDVVVVCVRNREMRQKPQCNMRYSLLSCRIQSQLRHKTATLYVNERIVK